PRDTGAASAWPRRCFPRRGTARTRKVVYQIVRAPCPPSRSRPDLEMNAGEKRQAPTADPRFPAPPMRLRRLPDFLHPSRLLLVAVAVCASTAAFPAPPRAEDAARFFRSIRAARRNGPIRLDGRPDEAAWLEAELGAGFTQFSPDEGARPSVETRFRVLWDDDAIYLGVECDDPLPATATMSRRDRPVDGDYISF